jgi:hypothetical protein
MAQTPRGVSAGTRIRKHRYSNVAMPVCITSNLGCSIHHEYNYSSLITKGYPTYHDVFHNHSSVFHVLFLIALKLVTHCPAYYNE